jgi:DNA invertase Pin-like site-specific DNA recombinase
VSGGKFISYIRVSTQRQGASGLGLEAQQEAVRRYLNGGDWHLIDEFREIETGKGSDALTKRPQLRAALEACQRQGATLVIARLDRLARSVLFIAGLMESRVKFVACDMPEANELTLHIMAAFAEHEAKRISQRTKDAIAAKKARVEAGTDNSGVRTWRDAWGVSGRLNLRPNIEARKQAADAFAAKLRPLFDAMRARGLSQRKMTRELNEIGLATPNGGQWRLAQVQRVLARLVASM